MSNGDAAVFDMDVGRIRNSVGWYTWISVFFLVLIGAFFVGFHPEICHTPWPDRLYILWVFIPLTGIIAMINVGNWWGRMVHLWITALLFAFFFVLFWTYMFGFGFLTAGCQPGTTEVYPGVCTGGRCNNPWNPPEWYCKYNDTAEAALCEAPCLGTLCTIPYSAAEVASRMSFSHMWLFYFTIVFLVFTIVDFVFMYVLHSQVMLGRREIAAGIAQQQPSSVGAELVRHDAAAMNPYYSHQHQPLPDLRHRGMAVGRDPVNDLLAANAYYN